MDKLLFPLQSHRLLLQLLPNSQMTNSYVDKHPDFNCWLEATQDKLLFPLPSHKLLLQLLPQRQMSNNILLALLSHSCKDFCNCGPTVTMPGQHPPTLMAVSFAGQQPPTLMAVSIARQQAPTTMAVSIAGQQPPTTIAASIAGQQPLNLMAVSIAGQQPPNTMAVSIAGQQPPATITFFSLKNRRVVPRRSFLYECDTAAGAFPIEFVLRSTNQKLKKEKNTNNLAVPGPRTYA